MTQNLFYFIYFIYLFIFANDYGDEFYKVNIRIYYSTLAD
jgi:hypothetical protein